MVQRPPSGPVAVMALALYIPLAAGHSGAEIGIPRAADIDLPVDNDLKLSLGLNIVQMI